MEIARGHFVHARFLFECRYLTGPRILPLFLCWWSVFQHRIHNLLKTHRVQGVKYIIPKHFTCDVRTVNRALSAILGPETERKKPESRKGRKATVEALICVTEPAVRLARKYPADPDAVELLDSLDTEELSGMVPEPKPRVDSFMDKERKYKRIKTEELLKMGLQLAHAVVDDRIAVRGDTPKGKRILGIAKSMLEVEKKAELPQDDLSRSPGSNFVVDDDVAGVSKATPLVPPTAAGFDPPTPLQPPKLTVSNYYLVHVGIEDGKPIIAKYFGAFGKKHQFMRRASGIYNVRDIGKVIRPANEKEIAEELAWEAMNKKALRRRKAEKKATAA
jgi:hypothetical protein